MIMRLGRYNFKLTFVLLILVGCFYGIREFNWQRYEKQQERQPIVIVNGKIRFISDRNKDSAVMLLNGGKITPVGLRPKCKLSDYDKLQAQGFSRVVTRDNDGEIIRETIIPKNYNFFEYDISRDGKWILFSSTMSEDNRTKNLYLIDNNGKNLTQVTFFGHNGDGASDPRFSCDGEKIAFIAPKEEKNSYPRSLYVCKKDGSQLRELTSDKISDAQGPAWSPDGAEIAFSSLGKRDSNGIRSNIYIMNLKANEIRALTDFNDKNYGHAYQPCWSPDGKQICFSLATRGNNYGRELFAINVDGTNLIRLTPAKHINRYPGWVSDMYPDWRE